MINNTQEKLISIRANALNYKEKEAIIEELLKMFESSLGITIDRNTSSNFYIIAKMVAEMGVDNLAILNEIFIDMNNFFDTNKFDGYLGSDYNGCRQALLNTGLLSDCKFYNSFTGEQAGQVQTVLLGLDGVDLKDMEAKNKIAEVMHNIMPVGTVNYSAEVGAITTKYTASTGQELSYTYYEASIEPLELWVDYFLDYEDFNRKIDYANDIKEAIINLYNQKYGFIGKDFILNDFRGIIKEIAGLKDIKYYKIVENVKGAEIVDNIEVGNLKLLKITKLNINIGA